MIYETDKVYTFKMNSGEEVVAKVVESGPDSVILSEPVSIAPGPQGMGLVPSMFTADKDAKVRLNTSGVTMSAETADEVKDKYLEATTGIKVPSKKLILG